MNLNNLIYVILALTILCNGCGQQTDTSVQISKSFPELVAELSKEANEFNFLLSEDAGSDALKDCTDRMQDILQVLPVAPNEQKIEKLKETHDSLAKSVEDKMPATDMSKANNKIRRQLRVLSRISN